MVLSGLFLAIFFFSNVFSQAQPLSSADLWGDIHKNSGDRGSHWTVIPENNFLQKESMCYAYGFFQTNWGVEKAVPKLLQDVFLLNKVESLVPVPEGYDLANFPVDTKKIINILKNVVIQNVTSGVMLHCSHKFGGLRMGFDLPLVYKVNHPWVSQAEQDEVKKSLLEAMNVIKDQIGSDINFEFVDEIKQRLSDLWSSSQYTEEFGLGDLRLFFEKDFLQNSQNLGLCLGFEAFLALQSANNLVKPALDPKKIKFRSDLIFDDFKDFVITDQERIDIKTGALSFLENAIATVQASRMHSQTDYQRNGLGLYARPSVMFFSNKAEFFAKLRATYLLPVNKNLVVALKDYPVLETFGADAKMQPVQVLQATIGVNTFYKNYYFGAGYDFFAKSAESISEFVSGFRDFLNRDLSSFVVKEKSQSSSALLHRVYANIGYQKDYELSSVFFNLSANYSFRHSGPLTDSWGFGGTLGFSF